LYPTNPNSVHPQSTTSVGQMQNTKYKLASQNSCEMQIGTARSCNVTYSTHCRYYCISCMYVTSWPVLHQYFLESRLGMIHISSLRTDDWWLLSPRAGRRNCSKTFNIVEIYWHDHSLESSWGALSVGTISFLTQPFSGEQIQGNKSIYEFCSENPSAFKIGCCRKENKVGYSCKILLKNINNGVFYLQKYGILKMRIQWN
jgi:hypothetical protein